ncbi:hypothetical protein [Streptosporangium sp. KLBMP 9127]|nr:hypothetical protein [Streptosporangium sp. KLBMP 9127]
MRQLRDFAVTVLVLAVLGVAAGVAWSAAAPRAPFLVTPEGTRLADPATQALIAADGWFAVVTGAAGLVCGVAGYWLGRRRPLPVLLGLAGGGLVASFLARWIGGVVNLGAASVAAPTGAGTGGGTGGGTVTAGALALTATGVLVTWSLLAVSVYGLLAAIGTYGESRKPPYELPEGPGLPGVPGVPDVPGYPGGPGSGGLRAP